MDRRIAALEVRVHALTVIVAVLAIACIGSFGLSLWAIQALSKVDHDTISVMLTILEILLIVIALGGFWMLRSVVREKAEQVAEEVAAREAIPVARRSAQDWLDSKDGADTGGLREALDAED